MPASPTIYFLDTKTGFINRATQNESTYEGLLQQTSQKRCTNTKILCYKLISEEGAFLFFLAPNESSVKQSDLVNFINKKVNVRGQLLMHRQGSSVKKYLLTSAITVTTNTGITVDEKGFLKKNGQRFFPIGIYSRSERKLYEDVANLGFNMIEHNDARVSQGSPHDDFAWGKELGLKTVALFQGSASQGYACNLSSGAGPECAVCSDPNKLCPRGCNYCNKDWAKLYVDEVKNYEALLGYYPVDEPGGRLDNYDPRINEVYQMLWITA